MCVCVCAVYLIYVYLSYKYSRVIYNMYNTYLKDNRQRVTVIILYVIVV